MMAPRHVAAAGIVAGLMAIVAWGSTTPLTVHDGSRAAVRLAWSARPERIEVCRERTAEELARLPAHMRQALDCVGSTAEYQLTVHANGERVASQRVHGAGLRRDRRLFVLREIDVEPGRVRIDVRFDRIGGDNGGGTGVARGPRGRDVAPPHLAFGETLEIAAGGVVLITYDPERDALVARRQGAFPERAP